MNWRDVYAPKCAANVGALLLFRDGGALRAGTRHSVVLWLHSTAISIANRTRYACLALLISHVDCSSVSWFKQAPT